MRPILAAYIVKQLSADQSPNAQRRRAAGRSRRSRRASAATPQPVRQERVRARTASTPQPTGEA